MRKSPETTTLIIPPSSFLANQRVFPDLGPLKVASAMEAKEHNVQILDLSGIENYKEALEAYLEGEGSEISRIGISATTPQFPPAAAMAEIINRKNRKTILGGAHATMVGSAYELDQERHVEHRGTKAFQQMTSIFDTIVIGDGELAIFEALKEDAPKVIDAGNELSPFFLQRGSLENFPFPNRDLIDLGSYHYEIDGKNAQSMIAQLGCPFEVYIQLIVIKHNPIIMVFFC